MYLSLFRLCHRDGANNVSISALAKKHKVSKTTLWKRITGRVLGAGHQSGGKGKGCVLTPSEYYRLLFRCWVLFFQTVCTSHNHIWETFCFDLTADDERKLAEIIRKFARREFPFTKNRVMSLAYEYARMNGRKGFSKITKQARWWWLKDFLKHFPEVCLKMGHNLSVN